MPEPPANSKPSKGKRSEDVPPIACAIRFDRPISRRGRVVQKRRGAGKRCSWRESGRREMVLREGILGKLGVSIGSNPCPGMSWVAVAVVARLVADQVR